jgi:hypothetical protein
MPNTVKVVRTNPDGMIVKSDSTTAKTANNEKLKTPIPYSWEWEEFPDKETLVKGKGEMTLDEQVKFRNDQNMTRAKAKALAAALENAGIEKPNAENSPLVRLKDAYRSLLTAKNPETGEPAYTPEQAAALASQITFVPIPEGGL